MIIVAIMGQCRYTLRHTSWLLNRPATHKPMIYHPLYFEKKSFSIFTWHTLNLNITVNPYYTDTRIQLYIRYKGNVSWCLILKRLSSKRALHIIKLSSFSVIIRFRSISGKLNLCRYFHHVLQYLRMLYIVWSLMRRRLTRISVCTVWNSNV